MMSDVLRSVIVKFFNDHIPTVTCASSLNVRMKNLLMDEFRSERLTTVTNETVIEIGDANDESENSLLWAKKLKEQLSQSWTCSALNTQLNFLFSQSWVHLRHSVFTACYTLCFFSHFRHL